MHYGKTGAWFIEGQEYVKWKETPDSALWIYGTRESLRHSGYSQVPTQCYLQFRDVNAAQLGAVKLLSGEHVFTQRNAN